MNNSCMARVLDYDGFESDEAVEGSSSEEDDVDEDEEEGEEESSWVGEKEKEVNENEPPRLDSGIEEPGADRLVDDGFNRSQYFNGNNRSCSCWLSSCSGIPCYVEVCS